jgi:hypothetical protein
VAVATNALAYIKAVLLTTLKCFTHEPGVNIDNIILVTYLVAKSSVFALARQVLFLQV